MACPIAYLGWRLAPRSFSMPAYSLRSRFSRVLQTGHNRLRSTSAAKPDGSEAKLGTIAHQSAPSGKVSSLFERVERTFPATIQHNWYLTTVGSLIGAGQPALVGELYSHITSKPSYQTSNERQQLVRRLREALIKCIPLCGIPAVMVAVTALAKQERDVDQDHTISRIGWQVTEESRANAQRVLDILFTDNRISASLGSHKDIPWISTNIVYGLFLADHRILGLAETEMVVLPAILCQGLTAPTSWHQRGSILAGLSLSEVMVIQNAATDIAWFCGREITAPAMTDFVTDAVRQG